MAREVLQRAVQPEPQVMQLEVVEHRQVRPTLCEKAAQVVLLWPGAGDPLGVEVRLDLLDGPLEDLLVRGEQHDPGVDAAGLPPAGLGPPEEAPAVDREAVLERLCLPTPECCGSL